MKTNKKISARKARAAVRKVEAKLEAVRGQTEAELVQAEWLLTGAPIVAVWRDRGSATIGLFQSRRGD